LTSAATNRNEAPVASWSLFRHAFGSMLCLAVSPQVCDPRLAVSRGAGIELILILPR
jgi:hypothetical protein